MIWCAIVYFLAATGLAHAQQENLNILCTDQYCTTYLETHNCPNLPDRCKIQNATHNGLVLPSPDYCNCCPFCLDNLGEGEPCAVGAIGGVIPDTICGPGLACVGGTCERMPDAICIKAQDDYDKRRADGTLGNMEIRPDCDDDGLFKPYKCVPGQTCFCVDKNGNRIFGEIPYTDSPEFLLYCPCSRKYHDAVEIIGKDIAPNLHFRCTDNGDFDNLQCISEKDCLCVDASDAAPTYPKTGPVPITEISNKTLPCFDNKIYTTDFYYPCALKYVQIQNETNQLKEKEGYDLIFDYILPVCTLDGKFGGVQQNTKKKYCADSDGKQLENFQSDLTDSYMDCKCARTRSVMKTSPFSANSELPECCPNGNFNKMQCRRGFCRCVDNDGYQIEKEVPQDQKKNLSCYENQC